MPAIEFVNSSNNYYDNIFNYNMLILIGIYKLKMNKNKIKNYNY